MDEKDWRIIEVMMKNGRVSKTELAKQLNITEAAVRKRIQKLEKARIILSYKAVINYKSAGLTASLTGIDIEPEKLWSTVGKIRQVEEVKSLWLTTGDHTVMAEIIAKNTDELSTIHDKISKIDGVRRLCPSVIIDVLK
jgi:Lrp/AsnC family transcriptional regulator for asnA, asnC and gidA